MAGQEERAGSPDAPKLGHGLLVVRHHRHRAELSNRNDCDHPRLQTIRARGPRVKGLQPALGQVHPHLCVFCVGVHVPHTEHTLPEPCELPSCSAGFVLLSVPAL